MNTQTDSQASLQVHALVAQHHQQQHSPTQENDSSNGSDIPCDNMASNSRTAVGSTSSLGPRQRESSTISAPEAHLSSSDSYPAKQAEAALCPSTPKHLSIASPNSQSPLSLQQFTHQPLQHFQHHHLHSTTTLHDNDLSQSCTSQPLSTSLEGPMTLAPTDELQSVPSLHPYISTDEVPSDPCDSRQQLSQSASFPLYLASDPSPQIVHGRSFDSSTVGAAEAPVDQVTSRSNDCVEFSAPVDCSNVDFRDPRTSIGNLTDMPSRGNTSYQAETTASSSNGTLSSESNAYGATLTHGGAEQSSRDLIQTAQHNASEKGAVGDAARLRDALPSSPSFASYCSSTTSVKAGQNSGQSMLHSLPASSSSSAQQFASPNALLHRRLVTTSQHLTLKRSRLSPTEEASSSSPVLEQRRNSLGSDLSPSSPTSGQIDAASSSNGSTFQLQPVPLNKRKSPRRSSLAKRQIVNISSPRMEKRLRIESPARQPSIASRQHNGFLTSIFKPADPVQISAYDSHSFTSAPSLDSREQSKKPLIALAELNTPSQPRSRLSRPRLIRTQSLPNLKAIPEMDISLTASHRLALPPRLVGYLSSLRERAQKQQQAQMTTTDGVITMPALDRDRTIGNSMAPQTSAFARNGYCSTIVDSMGNVQSIFFPSLHPPITRQTLKELDLHEILKNPQLRHDIVFDANVQFRPNFDGERGRKKKEFGNKYWYAVQKEIETGCTCTSFNGKMLLPCACGLDNGKTATGQYAGSLSSIRSPMPSLANYSHSGPSILAASTRNAATVPMTPAQSSARTKSPRSAIGLGSGRIPSRIPLLIQELRAICLSVLPSSSSMGEPHSPTTAFTPSTGKVYTPASARVTASTPLTASSSVATHHILIAQALDPLLITQQLQHGLLDIASLMSFLGSILKLHCAPMRDEVIETMIKTVCVDGEVGMGLRMCFEILELMKLDTANHQLRSSRMYLIETAVDFEIRWFREQLDQRKIGLERTRQWYASALQEQKEASNTLTRTKMITKSFDAGLLRLIMDPALGSTASSAATLSPTSLKTAYTSNYPETFQFDAYRLMSFHGDVTDITIVYMLLLLFRQLSCSSSNLAQGSLPETTLSAPVIQENASNIASRQLNSVKNEIWTLLNDADQEITTAGSCPKTPATPALNAGRLLCRSALSGTQKLDNPAWRKAMNDVVLQIAARAIEVQIQARKESRAQQTITSPILISPPREETMKMLMSWIETNLRRDSALHQICQQRLKTVLLALLDDDQMKDQASKMTRRDREESHLVDEKPSKRIRLSNGIAVATSHKESISKSDVESAIQKGGLEPFVAEIKLLSDRIIKVRNFHLRVFRSLYEKIAGEVQDRDS